MDSNIQALFSHISNQQMKAILKDLWKKNEENRAEIVRLQQELVKAQGEAIGLLREKITNEERKSELVRHNQELDKKYSELQEKYSECERYNARLESEIQEHKITCPVCLEDFDTEAHQPYALSCPHMVCAECLYPALESRNNRNNQGESHPSKRCPVCRARVNTSLKKICLQS